MWIDIFNMFAFSLGLTIIIEIIFARLWGLKTKKETLLVVLVNILTNPAAVFFAWISFICLGSEWYIPAQCIIEVVVVVVEANVYLNFAFKEGWNIKKPLKFAIMVNMLSWLFGVVVQNFI